MKKVSLLLMIPLCLFLLISSCSSKDKMFKIKVGYNAWVGYAGVFSALKKDFFKEKNLDVQLVAFSGPVEATQALLGGNLDVALTTLDNAVIMADKVQGRVLQVVYIIDGSNGADAIVASPAIKSVSDLKGKQIGVSIGQVNHFLLMKAFEKAGLKESDAKLVNMNSDAAGAAFMAGKIDAAVTWEPYLSNAVHSGKGKIVFSSKDAPGVIIDVALIAPKISQKKLTWVKSFVTALEKGRQYLNEHPAQGTAIAGQYLEVKPEEVTEMLKTVKLYSLKENQAILTESGLIGRSVEEMESFFKARNMIAKKVDLQSLIANEYLK